MHYRTQLAIWSLAVATTSVALSTEASAKVLTKVWQTPSSISEGDTVEGAGDVNGDGFDDVLVIDSVDGKLRLFRGANSGVKGPATWSTSIDMLSGNYTRELVSSGDINGDGFNDVAVGQVMRSATGPTGSTDGQVRVFFGSPTGLSNQAAWSISKSVRRFGFSVAAGGDFNGDGYNDLAVGDPYDIPCPYSHNQQRSGAKSAVYVYMGSSSGLSEQANWSYEQANNDGFSSCFGRSVTSAGDVNGDGYGDLLVGAPDYLNTSSGEGRAYVFEGSPAGLSSSPDWTSIHPGSKVGEAAVYGRGVTGGGDINGDGFDDIVIPAGGVYVEDNTNQFEGRAFVYLGSSSGVQSSASWYRKNTEWSLGVGMGDVDADGFSDISMPFDSSVGPEVGLFHGSSLGVIGQLAWSAKSAPMKSPFGRSVANAGDVNGDSYADVIVGRSGPAVVFHGGPNPPPSAQPKTATVVKGKSRTISLQATDPHGDTLTYSIVSNPSEGSITGINRSGGSVEYVAPTDYTGRDSFTFKAEDPYGGSDTAIIDVTVTPPNRAPEFVEPTPEGQVSTEVGQQVAFTVKAEDPDGDAVTYQASNLPEGASFDPQSREFQWTPTADDAGSDFEVSLAADDGELSTTRTVTIVVTSEPMEDVGVDAGDPAPDVGTMDDTGADASPETGMDVGNASPPESGCGCASARDSQAPPMSLIVFGILLVGRIFRRCDPL